MQDLTTAFQASSLATSTQPSFVNLAQPLLTALGWKDLKPALVAAEQADQALALELQQAYDAYGAAPDKPSQQRLQRALDQVIGELQNNLSRVKKLEKQAAKRLGKPQTNSSYLASVGSWLKQGAQAFFGSDDASLVARYGEIAQQRQAEIAQLSQLREGLTAQVFEAQKPQASAAEQEPIEDIISPLSRRLLQLQSTPAGAQYCYPSGSCDLSNLHEGLSGFVLQGETVSDESGYSISSAGDINGDGFDDLLVGARYASPTGGRTQAGKSYVVFGSNQTNLWGSGVLDLSSLMDGQRGFVLQGEAAYDNNGISVSSIGDVNGDRLADILVGAYDATPAGRTGAGKSYVVFGSRQTNAWGSGVLDLSSLMNGQRGFVLQGEAIGDRSGGSVSSGGDINGDGFDDVLVGAYRADPANRTEAGKSYVVFGSNQTNAWGSGTVDFSSLMNGQRGFALQGEALGDYSGYSVSSAGDINGDGLADVLVGAFGADPDGRTYAGKTYVVFGSRQTNAWGSGVLNLTSLINGQRGFVLQGDANFDFSGYSVSSAGDINGDGFDDVLVGADGANPAGRSSAGKTYAVFGSNQTSAWGTGVLDLSSLMDGQRGFALQGEATGDQSGYSVSSAGDINGDDFDDMLVGAYLADPANRTDAGKSYLVFGSNQTSAWGTGVLDLSSLMDGQRGFALQGEATGDQSGYSVSSAGDINGDGFDDMLVGAYLADVTGRNHTGKSYVVFGGKPAQLWVNQLTLYRGQTLILNSQNLNATDTRPVSFTITSVTHGQFEYISSPSQNITAFTQSQVLAGQVQFVHDGTAEAPSYSVQVGIGIAKLPPQNATVDFFGFGNRLTIHQAEALWMSNAFLDIVGSYPADQVNITISDLQHGGFFLAPGNTSATQFTQAQVLAGNVLFAHDGSVLAPSYNVTVTDPSRNVISAAEVTFYRQPVWLSNQLSLTQGDQLVLGSRHINVTGGQPASNVLFRINGLQHGQFTLAPANNTVTQFTQQQLLGNQVLFTHDKTGLAPSYQLTLNDSYFVLPPQPVIVNFTALAPTLKNNRLFTFQGRAVTLGAEDLMAIDPDPVLDDSAIVFTVSNVQQGQFTLNGSSASVIQFTQVQVTQGRVLFMQDDSTTAPSYSVTVGNPYRNSTSAAATIGFDARPLIFNNRLTLESGQSVVLAITDLRAIDDITVSNNLLFQVSNVQHGYFSQLQALNTSITAFSQERIRDAEIQFKHDGSVSPPSYTIIAIDGSDLTSFPQAAQIDFKPIAKATGGLDLQKLYASVSSVSGIVLAIAGYLWWRRKVTGHRRGFELANTLRKAANLEYHDFMRFDGDVFKSKIENFLSKVDTIEADFYKRLTLAEKKSFAVCIAELLEQRKLLKPSGYGMGIYGWMLAFSVGWSQQLDFKQFEAQLTEIAQQAVTAWQAEENPTARWPYFSPTTKDKVNAFCCARPSRAGMFARDKIRLSRSGEGVSMTELKDSKHQVIDMPSSSQKDVLEKTVITSPSPRFFDSSASSQELALFRQEVTGQFKQVSEGMQYMHHGMQEVVGNVKAIHDEVEQLKAETRPLLFGPGSSSS